MGLPIFSSQKAALTYVLGQGRASYIVSKTIQVLPDLGVKMYAVVDEREGDLDGWDVLDYVDDYDFRPIF